MAFDFSGKPQREPLAPDVYDAICIGVWDIGTHDAPPQFPGAPSHRMMLAFYLKAGIILQKEYAMNIYKNPKTGVKTALATDLDSWVFPKSVFKPDGTPWPVDITKRLGEHCQLRIGHNAKGYEKIESIHPPQDKNWECPLPLTVYEVGKTTEFPKEMPNFVIAKIKACHELAGAPQSSSASGGNPSQPGGKGEEEAPF